MSRVMIAAISIAALLLPGGAARGQERITSYDSEIQVRQDGSLEVVERIAVRAEGNQIRRGIYRDFPTRYRDRLGNRVRVDLQVLGVERNGVMEPWFTERMSNGVRINTGNDDFLPVPADYTFTIRYRTTRQLGFFEDHDELYWNAIGTGWVFPIEKGTVEVTLPAPVPPAQMSAEAYTGAQGAQGNAYRAEIVGPGVARYELTQPLGPYEGFTTVLMFPKGIVHQPTGSEKTQLFFKDNRGVFVALAGFIGLLFYAVRQWRAVGRDPQRGIIIARYEPSDGQSPAFLRYVMRMGYDMRCFTADVLALAVGGHLRIHKEDKFLKDEWRLDREASPSAVEPSVAQGKLLGGLFSGGRDTLVLKNTNATIVSAARQSHQKQLDSEAHGTYFRRNTKNTVIAVLIAVITTAIAFMSSGGFGIPAIIAIGVAMLITVAVFARLVRAPTKEGRELLDEIEGLKMYMSVAEKQELAGMKHNEPVLDAKRYEALLPYAVALDVEDAWTDKFTVAAGAAAAAQAAQGMTWYSGRGPITNLGDFTSSVSSGLNSTISSASTPPGSSSGGGGGGFSGGGGGGGGGGGR